MTSAGEKPEAREGSTIEVLARAMRDNYVRQQQAKGDGPATNPSLVSWDQADESLRASNRRFAEGIGEKLDAAGCALRPASAEATPPFRFTDQEIEQLARIEHER